MYVYNVSMCQKVQQIRHLWKRYGPVVLLYISIQWFYSYHVTAKQTNFFFLYNALQLVRRAVCLPQMSYLLNLLTEIILNADQRYRSSSVWNIIRHITVHNRSKDVSILRTIKLIEWIFFFMQKMKNNGAWIVFGKMAVYCPSLRQ